MTSTTGFDASHAFEIIEPRHQRAPVLFNSPHSGSVYPPGFLAASRLDPLTLRRSEDAYVDELFLSAPARGAPLIRAHFPRAFLDVNREPYELDPRMFDGRLPAFANTRSLRVAGGLGTIARVVGENHDIYRGRLSVAEGLARIDGLYKPYHHLLGGTLKSIRDRFGLALLVDCHSMPSAGNTRGDRLRADIVLGDRYGTSCAPEIMDCAEQTLADLGYTVARNRPYAGGYITENYGNPVIGLHALQIEINRGLYMDEARFVKRAGFDQLARNLSVLVERIMALPFEAFIIRRTAAE